MRKLAVEALLLAAHGEIPARGPRGGVRWTPRYFARRAAWHVLDRVWGIEDRLIYTRRNRNEPVEPQNHAPFMV